MVGKYAWEFSKNVEYWGNGTCDTIQECIEEAKEAIEEGYHAKQDVIYIGDVNVFVPMVDGEDVVEHIEEQAADEYGDVADGWEPWLTLRERDGEENARKAWSELDTMLSQVLNGWLAKHNLTPEFYLIENIREVSISG